MIKKLHVRLSQIVVMSSTALCAWALLGAAAQAQTSIETKQAGVNSRIEVLGALFTPPAGVVANQSRMIFYRSNDSISLKGATGVFVNGQYHTSLIPGGYSQLCLEPGAVEIGTRQFQVGGAAKDPYDTLTASRLQAAQNQYFAVYEEAGRPVFKPVPAAQALKELATARMQMHTISRVTTARECEPAQATAAVTSAVTAVTETSTVPERFALAGDALFAFGKSHAAGLTQEGLVAIDQLIASIRNDYNQITHIHVIGHADPLGSTAANERLSEERAETVRRYIERVGPSVARITSEGRGSRQPVVNNCARVASPSAIACNQPNRRVVVEVIGQRKVKSAAR